MINQPRPLSSLNNYTQDDPGKEWVPAENWESKLEQAFKRKIGVRRALVHS